MAARKSKNVRELSRPSRSRSISRRKRRFRSASAETAVTRPNKLSDVTNDTVRSTRSSGAAASTTISGSTSIRSSNVRRRSRSTTSDSAGSTSGSRPSSSSDDLHVDVNYNIPVLPSRSSEWQRSQSLWETFEVELQDRGKGIGLSLFTGKHNC